jgi:tetraacyldisaccharide 4'-kinase
MSTSPRPLSRPAGLRRHAPVVSVGNLAMGGRGKTPTVAHVASLLVGAAERPAILSRGYGRRLAEDGVVVVSDGRHLRADLDRSGDEPLMLARQLPGASVLVCDVRAMSAALAETTLGATIHVLDDGFQHRSLHRDIDLVLVAPHDLDDRRVPFGRLRSPVSALFSVHAVIVEEADAATIMSRLNTLIDATRTAVFTLRRSLGVPFWLEPTASDAGQRWTDPGEVVALAGIAAPDRFVRTLEAAGWCVGDLIGFRDHHRYSRRDLDRIATVARGRVVVTTEKDAVRLLQLRPLAVRMAAVPLVATVEPADRFRSWLLDRVAEVRA